MLSNLSFKYWDDCADSQDIEEMWKDPDVSTEWTDAGESNGGKVHLSRHSNGHPYLTQTEMKAVAGIVVSRHFQSQIDPDILCAIAELESGRQPLAVQYNHKTKQATMGIMQLLPKTADWLYSELGYGTYEVNKNPDLLYRPFVCVYLGAAYLKWLSNFEQRERSVEFVIRSYKGGTKKANHKSTFPYWRHYLAIRESLPSRKIFGGSPLLNDSFAFVAQPRTDTAKGASVTYACWDSRASLEDMEDMWNHPAVNREWTKSGEKQGKVRFSHDEKKRPYLSHVEIKAVAEIILSKYFLPRGVKAIVLCALAEMVSMRFVNGVGSRVGIMGIDYSTAAWLYRDLGYKAYKVESVDDLFKPFVSMYFGAAYMAWLSEYEGRVRSLQFVVQAYLAGPEKVNQLEVDPIWHKFELALSNYGEIEVDMKNNNKAVS